VAGYFNADSMLRRVTGEYVVALSGPRALLLMAAHPVAFAGFFAHTGALAEPYARLRRTGELLDLIAWGDDRRAADRATARVRSIHRRVRGELAEPAGRFPAGTPYRADDPDLLLWILASLADSAVLVFERWVRRLSSQQREALWGDYRVVGRLFGLRERDMPRDWQAFRAYMDTTLASGDLVVTEPARELATTIVLNPPLPLKLRPLQHTVNQITAGLLPGELRHQYGLGWDPLRGVALVAAGEYVRRMSPLLPERLRRTANARSSSQAR
jgi:uncharacterized protein (DUF2236 family)